MIFNDSLIWICFHGIYDFAYLVKLILDQDLPNDGFNFLMHLYLCFPNFWDIKLLIQTDIVLSNFSLGKLSDFLKVKKIGESHQAGSDSLLTTHVFLPLINFLIKNFDNSTEKVLTLINASRNKLYAFMLELDSDVVLGEDFFHLTYSMNYLKTMGGYTGKKSFSYQENINTNLKDMYNVLPVPELPKTSVTPKLTSSFKMPNSSNMLMITSEVNFSFFSKYSYYSRYINSLVDVNPKQLLQENKNLDQNLNQMKNKKAKIKRR